MFARGIQLAILLSTTCSCMTAFAQPRQVSSEAEKGADSFSLYGWINAGAPINLGSPINGVNWGQQITDFSGLQLNQAVASLGRDISSEETLDWAVKISAMVGSDSRYAQLLGQTEYLIPNRIQFVFPEAYAKIHLPLLHGIDIKVGQFLTYNGIESLFATENFFYSHSYTSEFGPWTSVGALVEAKLTDNFQIYGGPISGLNTTIGWPGDNNAAAGAHIGFNISLLDGDLLVSGANVSAPNTPKQLDPYRIGWPFGVIGGTPVDCACDPNRTWAFFNNLMITYNMTDKLSLMTDINFNRDDAANTVSIFGLTDNHLAEKVNNYAESPFFSFRRPTGADSYGAALYAIYKKSDEISLGARAEFWRDSKNFFANVPFGAFDTVNSLHGYPNTLFQRSVGEGTSYMEMTVGAKISAKLGFTDNITEIVFRPQARWDVALNNSAPFFGSNAFGGKKTQGMLTFDVILPFKIR